MTVETARVLIEVTAGVLPPDVQLQATCGSTTFHVPHGGTGPRACSGAPLNPTGWSRNRPEPEHTRVFAITGREWEAAGHIGSDAQRNLLANRAKQATDYAASLMGQPDRFNHVRVDWIWL